jgi:tetratricopeptide (TPR) repeat protein
LYFDLNHVNTFEYEHLGADIGAREASRAKAALSALILDVMQSSAPDSPVYTYLPKLQHPRLSDDEYEALLDETEEAQERLSHLLELGEKETSASKFKDAAEAYKAAAEMKPDDPYILQRLALATYKSSHPSAFSALLEAHKIIQRLSPDTTNDPETTGLAGAIHKRMWKEVGDVTQLDMAIRYYRRGFELRRDYYNGENLATCFDLRASKQSDHEERIYDRMSAKKIRETLIDLLSKATEHKSFQERSDVHWVYATLANASFALGNDSDGHRYEEKFLQMNPARWEKETYLAGKNDVMQSISN